MNRLLALIPLLLLLAVAPSSAVGQGTNLVGVVGTNDGFTISLADENGSRVRRLDPGTYTIHVSDRSDLHDFHLFGPGVDQTTPVEGLEEVTWTVTFRDATYRFQCDPHSTTMRGSIVVGNPPQEAEPKELEGQVGPGARISVKRRGTRVRTVAAGRYRLEVRDRTRRDNFHLTGRGVNRRTGVRAQGTVRWTLQLRAGATYRYRSDAHPALRGTLRAR
jgi:plastocyanin